MIASEFTTQVTPDGKSTRMHWVETVDEFGSKLVLSSAADLPQYIGIGINGETVLMPVSDLVNMLALVSVGKLAL